jgi:hypothetical protein
MRGAGDPARMGRAVAKAAPWPGRLRPGELREAGQGRLLGEKVAYLQVLAPPLRVATSFMVATLSGRPSAGAGGCTPRG